MATEQRAGQGWMQACSGHFGRWIVLVVGVAAAQGVSVMALMGGWESLCNEQPVLSGRHGVHQYHGVLGAAQLRRTGQNVCYDPAFEAGYPKTPVFDEGCRLAELLFLLSGGEYVPAVYKWGVWGVATGVPLAALLAAGGCGLSYWSMAVAGLWGCLLSWSIPFRTLLAEGMIDGIAAGMAAVVFVPWLARFSKTLSVEAWLVCAASCLVIWYCAPLLWLPLGLVVFWHYVVMAPRRGLVWHLAYLGIACVGILPNAWWLVDWGKYWWLRPAMESASGALRSPWDWGGLPAGGVIWAVGVLAALIGGGRQRHTGHLLAVAAMLGAFAVVKPAAEPLVDVVEQRALETLTVAWALAGGLGTIHRLWHWGGWWRGPALLLTGAVTTPLVLAGWTKPAAWSWPGATHQLRIGWTVAEQQLLNVLTQHTSRQARILWEEHAEQAERWSALLPLWTDRWYIGGLHAPLEHSYGVLREGHWLGRPLEQWSDAELDQWVRRFNLGWVVTRTDPSARRWGRYPKARLLWQHSPTSVAVWALDRPFNYLLSGQAAEVTGSVERLVLREVVPDDQGSVVLSGHWQAGMRVSPAYVRVERSPDPEGRATVDFIRLQMPGPVPRIAITWDNP
ncbi:MAG: hypothetical protein NZ703_00045 [Gemmataceae bacterium]|nr:hypothetical protein [Gemmataceae bacterium]MCS7269451.1 hypothetical protein [Gemmataceae bacterium]MDW8242319.1 hypothetical protein [Thermogemmata sp.]